MLAKPVLSLGASPDDHAGATYLRVVVDELERLDRRLVPPERRRHRLMREAHVPAEESRRLFDYAYRQGGSTPLLMAGRGAVRSGFDPGSYLVDLVRDVSTLLRVWMELQVRYHSHLRIEIVALKSGQVRLRHHSLRPDYALSTAETLIVAGLLLALIERLGHDQIRCEIGPGPGEGTSVYLNGRYLAQTGPPPPARGGGNEITFTWRERPCEPGRREHILAEAAESNRLIQRVMLEVSRDLDRNWAIDEVAQAVATSKRTLQRTFQSAGVNFKAAVAATRLRAACHMLCGTFMPITDIALACGFTDSAHFARQFRRAAAMTPSEYRRIGYLAGLTPRSED